MTVKEAVAEISRHNLFRVPRRCLNQTKDGKLVWECLGHKKVHKYTFHTRLEFAPGMVRMIGCDTIPELIKIAEEFKSGERK